MIEAPVIRDATAPIMIHSHFLLKLPAKHTVYCKPLSRCKCAFYLTFSGDIELLLTEWDKDIKHFIKPSFHG